MRIFFVNRVSTLLCALALAAAGCAETARPEAADASPIGVAKAAIVQDAVVTATSDTYIKELAPTKGFGTETSFRVQSLDRQRGIVQFSQAALVAAAAGRTVTEAQLELSVLDIQSWWWGQVAVHRLAKPSTEAGATWSCANDTTPSNSSNDCTSANTWSMTAGGSSTYAGTASDVMSIGFGTTVIRLNVTNDVKAFLAGTTPNNGWLLKAQIEGPTGVVRIRSRESATPPKLILDLAGPACVPSAQTDTTCNGVDDDCSGTADEDFVSAATSCGVGACRRNGATSCVAGAVVNSCAPGAPAASDASCDGVDQDCSGSADEDFVAAATSCGVGACARSGATSCVAGNVQNSCAPGAPAANDASCNAIDDDCNGTADEDFVVSVTGCGIGACVAVGAMACVAGNLVNSCTPGLPLGNDASCNAIDDDCDSLTDEAFTGAPTQCGEGICGASGATACIGGSVVDSCTPVASCEGDCNDELDDDGDSDVDCDDADCATDDSCESTINQPCERASDCVDLENPTCLSEAGSGIPGGACLAFCADDSDCPGASYCFQDLCVNACDQGACPAGESCLIFTETEDACLPSCTSNADCNDGRECNVTTGFCENVVVCQESDTTCNAVDDDCNGLTDDGCTLTQFNIESYSQWDGVSEWSALCPEGAWGQTFTLSGPSSITQLGFFLRTLDGFDPLKFRIQLVAWDAGTGTAVGPVLFETNGSWLTSETFGHYGVGTPNLFLAAGTYAAIVNSAALGNSAGARGAFAVPTWTDVNDNPIDAIQGGSWIHSQCTGELDPTLYSWTVEEPKDLVFYVMGYPNP